jgi:hypothetical protein
MLNAHPNSSRDDYSPLSGANKDLDGLGQRYFIDSLLQFLCNDDTQDIDSLMQQLAEDLTQEQAIPPKG